jgi:hypothetical protein
VSDLEFRFPAEIVKVQTLADHGIRVTLDLPETAIAEASKLMVFQATDVIADITVRPLNNKVNKNGTTKGNNKQSRWSTSQE